MNVRIRNALPWVALLTVCFVWGSTYLAIRVAVQTIPPFLMVGSRYAIAGGLLYVILMPLNGGQHRFPSRAEWISLWIKGLSLFVTGNALLCREERELDSGVAALLVATVPMFMIFFEALVERRGIVGWSLIGLIGGTLGVVLLTGLPGSAIPLVPALIVVFASFSWAAGSVYAHHSTATGNSFHPAIEMMIGGAGCLLIGSLSGELQGFDVSTVSHTSLVGWIWLILPGSVLAYSAYMCAVGSLPSGIVSTYAYVNPLVAVALGVLIGGETLTRSVLVGGSVIVLSVAAIIIGGTRRERKSRAALSEIPTSPKPRAAPEHP